MKTIVVNCDSKFRNKCDCRESYLQRNQSPLSPIPSHLRKFTHLIILIHLLETFVLLEGQLGTKTELLSDDFDFLVQALEPFKETNFGLLVNLLSDDALHFGVDFLFEDEGVTCLPEVADFGLYCDPEHGEVGLFVWDGERVLVEVLRERTDGV